MVVEPGTAILIASAISAAAKGAEAGFGHAQSKKMAKRKAKETKRETRAEMLSNAMNRSAEAHAHKMSKSEKLGKRRSQSLQNTADLVREAFKI